MSGRPIIFSGPMVRALLDGRKTQTRRVLTAACDEPPAVVEDGVVVAFDENNAPYRWPRTVAVGDRLWVRETWATVNSAAGPGWAYRADSHFIQPEYDGEDFGAGPSFNYEKYPGSYTMWFEDLLAGADGHGWSSPIHMPLWASRLTLTVADVRVQRLQEISHDDAVAEGVGIFPHSMSAQKRFRELWDSINASRGYGWDANSWVVALTFTVERRNIDSPSPEVSE